MRNSTRRVGNLVVRFVGPRRISLPDLYHLLITARWRTLALIFTTLFLGFNCVFSLLYLMAGPCIENARPGSFWDHFFFSVQTMATVGYGTMAPKTFYANALVTVEIMMGLILFAVTTGIVFSKFSRPTARVLFTRNAVFTNLNEKPMLLFRMANVRLNQIVDASVQLHLLRTEVTKEGVEFRRFYEIPLERSASPIFILSWTVMHSINTESPLHGLSVNDLQRMKAQLHVSVTGIDSDFSQTVHARHVYRIEDLIWGGFFEDVLQVLPDGTNALDLSKFDAVHLGEPKI